MVWPLLTGSLRRTSDLGTTIGKPRACVLLPGCSKSRLSWVAHLRISVEGTHKVEQEALGIEALHQDLDPRRRGLRILGIFRTCNADSRLCEKMRNLGLYGNAGK